MKTIAVISGKGGVGKTHVCVLAAFALAKIAKKITILDLDEQGSATMFASQLDELGVELIKNPKKSNGVRDYVFIDTPGTLMVRKPLTIAIELADQIVVPLAPTVSDIPPTQKTIAFIREVRPDIRIRALFNKVKKRALAGDPENIRHLSDQLDVPVFTSHFCDRTCYQYAWQKLGVLTGPAKDEINSVALELLT